MAFQEQCAADLAAAEPAIQKAEEALNGLDKGAHRAQVADLAAARRCST